jgi:hypothetical protein
MGDTWWVIIICPCVNVFSLMGGVTEADVGFLTNYVNKRENTNVWSFKCVTKYKNSHHSAFNLQNEVCNVGRNRNYSAILATLQITSYALGV